MNGVKDSFEFEYIRELIVKYHNNNALKDKSWLWGKKWLLPLFLLSFGGVVYVELNSGLC